MLSDFHVWSDIDQKSGQQKRARGVDGVIDFASDKHLGTLLHRCVNSSNNILRLNPVSQLHGL